ncbi:RHS repeat domain-containing protein [Pirellulaceae bacterium SH467]
MLETSPELCSARPRTGEPNATFGCTEATTPVSQCLHVHSIHASVGPSPDEATTATWRYQSNQQYSITAVTTSSGSVAERYAYTAYGQPTILDASGSVLSSSAINNRYTYTGREWDQTLGLYHFRARWMSGLAGRFMGRDPIGYASGQFSIVEYVVSNPLYWMDPLGTFRWDGQVPPKDGEKSTGASDPSTPGTFLTAHAASWAKSRCYVECFGCKSGGRFVGSWFGDDLANTIEVKAREPAAGLPDRKNSALRHCIAGGLMATYLGCACAACLEDGRDIAQWYSGTQNWVNTVQALHNDREGRWCGGCLNSDGRQSPLTPFTPSDQQVIECCKRKLRRGDLLIGSPRPNSPTFDPTVPPNWFDWWSNPWRPVVTFPGAVW